MTYTTLTPKQTYIISLEPNEEIIESVKRFVAERKIKSGYIIGLGAVKSVRLAHYSVPAKKYSERKFKKPLEITDLTGIITTDKIHVHITLTSAMFKGFGGHLVRAVVSGACELIVVETEEEVWRQSDEEIGLDLLSFK